MATFNELREKISITEIAEKLGYWKSSYPRAQHDSYCLGNKDNPIDEIVIYNPKTPSKSTYFSRKGGYNDKGNLINFVLNRLDQFNVTNTGLKGVSEALNNYLGNSSNITASSVTNPVNSHSNSEITEFNINYWNPQPLDLKTNSYLSSKRKLSTKTISDFQSKCHIYTVGKSNHIGFPFRKPGQMEITNFEMRNFFPENNQNYKGFCRGGNKSESCWIANFVPFNQVKDLYIFESAIDAMSFYELKGFSKETAAAFISIGGNVTKGQIEKLKEAFPGRKWHLCYDKDMAGQCFDVNTVAILKGIECKAYAKPDLSDNSKKTVHISNAAGDGITMVESWFNSKEYIELYFPDGSLEDIEIIKAERGKDWNDELVSYKRFDLNISPTNKINSSIDNVISQLDLKGYHTLSKDILAAKPSICASIRQRSKYELLGKLASTPVYTTIVYYSLIPTPEGVIPQINNLYIYDRSTNKRLPVDQLVNFFKKENIDILKDIHTDDFKKMLTTKKITVNSRSFECKIYSSGWNIKEVFKKKACDTSLENVM